MTDVASLPLRPLFEVVLVSFYTLYGGEQAYQHVRGAYVRELSLLPVNARSDSALVDDWTGPRDKLQW